MRAGSSIGTMSEAPSSYQHMYVHVPFCRRRCSYCDFSIAVRSVVPVAEYVQAVATELAMRLPLSERIALNTLYFGGGTPSRLGPDGVTALMRTIRNVVGLLPEAEITLEANPEDITPEAVRAWRDVGINRLSIGVQSFHDNVLTWMHRVHNAAEAEKAVRIARDGGISAFSLDLIFSVPAALNRVWHTDLDRALALQPDHISLYGLTIEPQTPLGRWQARGDVVESPEEQYEEEFLLANSHLAAAGFDHYEVSNFARSGKRAVHNSAYWRGVSYLGIGPSAHGFDGTVRRWNTSAYAAWLEVLHSGNDPVDGSEVLTVENRIAETVYLGLRTRDGLDLLETEYAAVSSWFAEGWLEWADSPHLRRVRCTPTGWLRLDSMAANLTALRSPS